MHKSSWDDLKFVLAVAEHGSVSAAARVLGVNHATVLRRVAAFEEAHGSAVFERSARGYSVIPEKMGLIGAARDAAAAMLRVEGMSRAPRPRGLVRVKVTSTDSLCTYLLAPLAPGFVQAGLALDLASSNDHIDLGRLRAEIAVRPSPGPPSGLTGIQAAELAISAFAPAGGHAVPWLGLDGALVRVEAARWLADRGHDIDPAGSADSFLVLHRMVAAGVGQAFLPTFLGRGDPRLEPVGEAPVVMVPIWVATHPELADLPRLARIRRQLAEAIGRQADWLSGRADYPA